MKIWVLATTGIGILAQGATAGTLVHLKKTVWGCVDPNVTPTINDDTNPGHLDPQWVARTSDEGHCVAISPASLWEPLSPDYNGLTYVAYRGTVGRPGSFWVPTSAIDFNSPVRAAPSPSPPVITRESLPPPKPPPPPEERSVVREALQAQQTAASQPSVSPMPEPLVPTTPPLSASNAPTDGQDGFGGGVLAVFALLAIGWLARRSRRRRAAKGRAKIVETRMQAPDVSFRIHSSSLTQPSVRPVSRKSPPSPRVDKDPARTIVHTGGYRIDPRSTNQQAQTARPPSNKPTFVWYPHGQAVTVAGMTIADGMVYVGHKHGSLGEHDASFIDPALPVASTSVSAGPLGYWPSYGALTPECRRRYLEWLASGRRAPDADIGYVFLYFYGLERRLLLEAPAPEEVRAFVAELNRLRTIYAHNRSFDGYSARLLEAVTFLQDAPTASKSQFVPLAAPWGEMPLSLKVAVAREVLAGRPLGFELAATALFGLREFWSAHRHVLVGGRPAFLAVLRPRFEATFRSGFPLRNRKDSHLQLVYHGASAGLAVDLAERAGLKDLPDPTTLTWTKLFALASTVAQEIAPYTKTLAYHPARANSLYGLVGCPAELRDAVALEARHWLEGLPSPAAVPFGELAGHAIGTATTKWSVRHRRQVSEALASMGYAMEPDPEDGAEQLEDGTLVQVFRCADRTKSRGMDVACAAAMLVAIVAKAVDGGADAVAKFWLSRLPSRLSLTSDQTSRLRARLMWLATRKVTLAKARRLLGDATPDEREFCAWSAMVAAGATGAVGKPQVAVLEAIHDALAVPRSMLYAGLHAGIGATAVPADEPVLVSAEVQETLYPIPPPPVADRADGELHRLARIRAETERVAAMLADIFVDDEPPAEAPEPAGEGLLAGLDPDYAALLTRLLTRSEWPREEFEGAASEAGLMPGDAMETINEWAFDHHGDALLEDGDPVVVNRALLPVYPEAVAAK